MFGIGIKRVRSEGFHPCGVDGHLSAVVFESNRINGQLPVILAKGIFCALGKFRAAYLNRQAGDIIQFTFRNEGDHQVHILRYAVITQLV